MSICFEIPAAIIEGFAAVGIVLAGWIIVEGLRWNPTRNP